MKNWNIPWRPIYFEVNDPFAEIRTASSGEFGAVFGYEVDRAPQTVRLGTPWEMHKALGAGNTYAPEVRCGMVTLTENVLGHGWVVVVPDWDPEYLAIEVPNMGLTLEVAKDLLLIQIEALTPYNEIRRRTPPRRGV